MTDESSGDLDLVQKPIVFLEIYTLIMFFLFIQKTVRTKRLGFITNICLKLNGKIYFKRDSNSRQFSFNNISNLP